MNTDNTRPSLGRLRLQALHVYRAEQKAKREASRKRRKAERQRRKAGRG